MKKKDLNSMRSKDAGEIEKLIAKKRGEVEQAYVDLHAGQEKNLKKVKNLREDLAQMLTILREKEIIGEEKKDKKGENK